MHIYCSRVQGRSGKEARAYVRARGGRGMKGLGEVENNLLRT